MNIAEGFNKYYDAFGFRGVLAISAYRLTGRPKEVRARPAGITHPLSIRVRTTDVVVYKEIFQGGQYEFDLPFRPRTIVDVGANTGLTSVYYTHKYPDARIIAIEPEDSNFRTLANNVAAYPSIVPIQAALWSRDGHISISEPDPATGAYGKWGFVTHDGAGAPVRSMTLPSVMDSMKLETIDILKVDIEGAEKEVFETSNDWMCHVRCLIIELHDRFKPGCSAAVESAMGGFVKLSRGETTFYVRSENELAQHGALCHP